MGDYKYYDKLINGRQRLVINILQNIEINSKYVEEVNGTQSSYNVSICGKYGSGKSFFIEAFKEYIEKQKNKDETNKKIKIIDINAWKTDFLDDPILSIGLSLKENIEKDSKVGDATKKNILNGVNKFFKIGKAVVKNSLPIAGNYALNYLIKKLGSSNHIKKIQKDLCLNATNIKFLDKISEEINKKQNEKIMQNYKKYDEYLENIKNSLLEYIKKCNYEKIFIIVDELDRCRPDYAVDFLEAINHIFNIKDLVFIFAIDREQLSSAMKVVYGKDLDFDAYFKKFVHYEFKLNDIEENIDSYKYINFMIKKYNEIYIGKREYLNELFKAFNLEPREIEYFFRVVFYLKKNIQNLDSDLIYIINMMFLIILRTKNNNLYYRLFSISNSNYEIPVNLDVLKEIFEKRRLNTEVATIILVYGICCNLIMEENKKKSTLILIYESFGDYLKEDFKKDVEKLKKGPKDEKKIVDKYFGKINTCKPPILKGYFDLLDDKKDKNI